MGQMGQIRNFTCENGRRESKQRQRQTYKITLAYSTAE